MNRLLPMIFTFVIVAATVACGGNDDEATPTPGSTGTSIEIVNAAVGAVTRKDAVALRQLVQLVKLPCATGSQAGPPASLKCAGGEPAGTMIDVLPAARDEGFYVRANGIEEELRRVLAPGFRLAMVDRGRRWRAPLAIQARHLRDRVL